MPQLDFSIWLIYLIFTWFSLNFIFIWVNNNKISNVNLDNNFNNIITNNLNWTWN